MATQRINLEPLLSFQTLSVDRCDSIESVRLASVTLDHCAGYGRLHVTLPRDAACDVHSYLQQCFGEQSPMASHQFQLIEARLAVQLHPANPSSRQTTLAIELSLPNICHLPKHPIYGYPLGETHLRQWGVLLA